MTAIFGALTVGLMVIVLVIAAGSLIIAATIPLGNWLQRRRSASDAPDNSSH